MSSPESEEKWLRSLSRTELSVVSRLRSLISSVESGRMSSQGLSLLQIALENFSASYVLRETLISQLEKQLKSGRIRRLRRENPGHR